MLKILQPHKRLIDYVLTIGTCYCLTTGCANMYKMKIKDHASSNHQDGTSSFTSSTESSKIKDSETAHSDSKTTTDVDVDSSDQLATPEAKDVSKNKEDELSAKEIVEADKLLMQLANKPLELLSAKEKVSKILQEIAVENKETAEEKLAIAEKVEVGVLLALEGIDELKAEELVAAVEVIEKIAQAYALVAENQAAAAIEKAAAAIKKAATAARKAATAADADKVYKAVQEAAVCTSDTVYEAVQTEKNKARRSPLVAITIEKAQKYAEKAQKYTQKAEEYAEAVA